MKIYLIRHGKTVGNLQRRYIGSTDEPLSPKGIGELLEIAGRNGLFLPGPEISGAVYVSGLLRTKETAELLFPGRKLRVRTDFNECDFGEFENKNYEELKDDPAYQSWIDSGGLAAPPDGEAKADFSSRTCRGFLLSVEELLKEGGSFGAFVVHGGSIMAILEQFAFPKKEFYDWQAKNGCGFMADLKEDLWKTGNQILTNIRSIP